MEAEEEGGKRVNQEAANSVSPWGDVTDKIRRVGHARAKACDANISHLPGVTRKAGSPAGRSFVLDVIRKVSGAAHVGRNRA